MNTMGMSQLKTGIRIIPLLDFDVCNAEPLGYVTRDFVF